MNDTATTGLRASDADREQTAAALGDALADGRLDHDEYSERLDAAYDAKTVERLAEVTADLGGPSPRGSAPGSALAVDGASENIVAVFGSASRAEHWYVEPRTNASTLFGGVTLDLREAEFSQRAVTVQCAILAGSLELIVPPGVRVDDRTTTALGHVVNGAETAGTAGAGRTVVLTGLICCGGVTVAHR
ncbi:DUF1707 SHOCT-like domain-containing protein [Nocardiopsis coralliicola]